MMFATKYTFRGDQSPDSVKEMLGVFAARGAQDGEVAHYVAANQFLDAFALQARANRVPALAVAWGPMSGDGMLDPATAERLSHIGVKTIAMEDAVAQLDHLLGSNAVLTTHVSINWPLYVSVYAAKRERPLFAELVGQTTVKAPARDNSFAHRLEQAPAGRRRDLLRGHIRELLSQVLGSEPDALRDPDLGFFDMGMDSLTSIELRDLLESSLATSLPTTLAFDYNSVASLSDFLLQEQLQPEGDEAMDDEALDALLDQEILALEHQIKGAD